MKHEEIGRLGAACIVAVLAGFLFLRTENYDNAILIWLLYTVGAGVILNTEAGVSQKRLALLALLPALTPLIMLSHVWLIMGEAEHFSGLRTDSPRFVYLILFFAAVSWAGIFLFSFTRKWILSLLMHIRQPDAATPIKNIEAWVRAIISLIAAVTLLSKLLIY